MSTIEPHTLGQGGVGDQKLAGISCRIVRGSVVAEDRSSCRQCQTAGRLGRRPTVDRQSAQENKRQYKNLHI